MTRLSQHVGPFDDVVIRLGRDRDGRHVVLRPLDQHGNTLAFAKLANSSQGRQALSAEADNLIAITDLQPAGIVAPTLLGYEEWEKSTLMAMSPLIGGADQGRPEGPPIPQMRALALAASGEILPLAGTPLMARLRGESCRLPGEKGHLMRELLGRVESSHGELDIPVGCWHGDWVPWNMATRGTSVLLWDWENFERGVPYGFDLLHFTSQQARMRDGTDRRAEDLWWRQGTGLTAQAFGLTPAQTRGIALAYLLAINMRYLMDRVGDPCPQPRRGWGLTMLQRLTAEEA